MTKSQPSSPAILRYNASFQSVRTTRFLFLLVALKEAKQSTSSPRSLTEQMGPDVASLGVDAEDAPEAGPKGGHGGPVAVQQVVVVLQPVREHVIRDDPPAALPDLQESALSTSGAAPAHWCAAVSVVLAAGAPTCCSRADCILLCKQGPGSTAFLRTRGRGGRRADPGGLREQGADIGLDLETRNPARERRPQN